MVFVERVYALKQVGRFFLVVARGGLLRVLPDARGTIKSGLAEWQIARFRTLARNMAGAHYMLTKAAGSAHELALTQLHLT